MYKGGVPLVAWCSYEVLWKSFSWFRNYWWDTYGCNNTI